MIDIFVVTAYINICVVYGQPIEDLITTLDGLTWPINYKQYSGYLSLDNGHQYFYWLTESQNDPINDPVVLWLNGGPGCSSIGDGLFYENGPFHIYDNGTVLWNNTYSWNLNANMLYLDTPICTGFSFNSINDTLCTMNVDENANDNYFALQKFFEKFEIYKNNPFYITGESFAGVLIPTLTLRILNENINVNVTNNTIINLKAFAVGNGRLSVELNYNSAIWFAYFHGLISTEIWNNLMLSCCRQTPYTRQNCNFLVNIDPKCKELVLRTMEVIQLGRVNPYNLFGDCYHFDGFSNTANLSDRDIITCSNTKGADIYFNNMNVRKQIHAFQNATYKWYLCVDTPYYDIEPKYDDMSHVIHNIFNINNEIYGLFYWGDTDLNQNVLGGQWFVNDLGYNVTNNYREWFYEIGEHFNRQVGGWTMDFNRFSFVTVRGAGHMVPQLRPLQSLKMFNYFLTHQQL